MSASHSSDGIVEVWEANLEEAFREMRDLVERYPYVAMVSPGTLGRDIPTRLRLIGTRVRHVL